MNKPLKVLIVEDVEDDALLMVRELRCGGYEPEFEIVETAEAMDTALGKNSWDIIISDYSLPGFNALAALNIVKDKGLDLPFIIVSGTIGEETAVECMRAGAHDYLMKGKLARLSVSVERELKEAGFRRELRNTKKNLIKSEQKYQVLVQSMSDIVFIVNPDGKISYLNLEFEKLTGYSISDVLGSSFFDIFASEDIEKAVGWFNKDFSDKEDFSCEMAFKHKSGKDVPVEIKMTFIMDGGINTGRIGLARDITERKKTEEALRESEEKYRSIMESMDDAIYICSVDFSIEYVNPAMIKRVGHNVIGEVCYKEIYGLDEKCPWCLLEEVMKNEVIGYEFVSPKDEKTYQISSSPISHIDGSISKLTVCRDVTEFKKMEVNLQQAQKMESIGILAGGIAHDFNNILFPILGYTEMLLGDIPENSLFANRLNEIYKGGIRGKELVKQILTFSRQGKSERKLMKMQPVIKEVLKLIRSAIPSTINIKQEINSSCGIINADSTQIHQIVMNLTVNAYHAMEETGGELKVGLKEITLYEDDVITFDITPGVYACLTITDTGMGVNKNLLQKIFDPFFTTKREGKGTGMGLSVVHGIVKSMDGTIQVYSEAGQGARFCVYLPVVKSSSEKHAIQTKASLLVGTEWILLVDDEEVIVEMEKQMLEYLGYHVTSRTSSIEALEAFRYCPDKFDLVITDMAMPNMSGEQLAAKLTKIRPDIPILLCTGFSETVTEKKAALSGISGFLLKPFVMMELSQKIREVMDDKKDEK